MTAMPHDILIIQKLDHLPARLQEFLHSKGYSSQTLADYKDIFSSAQKLRTPILILEGGATPPLSEKHIKEFLAQPFLGAISKLPLLFVGSGDRIFEEQLAKHFKFITSLDLGCGNNEILEAIEYLSANYKEERERSGQIEAKVEAVSTASEPITKQSDLSYWTAYRVPNLFFQELERTGLTHRRLNGDKYFSGQISPVFLESQGFFDMEPKTLSAVHKTLNSCDKWTNKHLCRATFMARQIADTLQLDAAVARHLIPASFLFSSAVIQSAPSLMRANYLRPGRAVVRKDLGSRVKDSALAVTAEIDQPELGNIIASVGRLIAGEVAWQDSDASLAASCIMISEYSDRLTFRAGAWDPRAAYTLMKKIKSQNFIDLHPMVMVSFMKFISEAVLAKPWTFLLPKHVRRNPSLIEQAKRFKNENPSKGETKIHLNDLTPGMKLSRPLVAFDGRKILAGDLTLDQDLIWRIWQLAAVRPLNSQVLVVANN